MANIFLSYRRHDSAGFAGRLSDALEAAFGAGSVFRDVDDIKPGQDYLTAIDTELRAARVVIVMIGPYWLTPDRDGQRRIDQPDDVVRHEVMTALAEGNPVVPVLVGGAAMPRDASLPTEIVDLARRNAMVLSDDDWRRDVDELIESLRAWLPPDPNPRLGWRRKWLTVAAVAAVGLVAVIGAGAMLPNWLPKWIGADRAQKQAATPDVAGRWHAKVKYDWGDQHDEVLEFRPLANALHGTASYLGGRLTIEQAKLDGEWLSFATRSFESLGGGEQKEAVHRYIGQVTPDGIRFTLETSGGVSLHTPVEFVALRENVAIAARPSEKERLR